MVTKTHHKALYSVYATSETIGLELKVEKASFRAQISKSESEAWLSQYLQLGKVWRHLVLSKVSNLCSNVVHDG